MKTKEKIENSEELVAKIIDGIDTLKIIKQAKLKRRSGNGRK
jgi:hypothetical protein